MKDIYTISSHRLNMWKKCPLKIKFYLANEKTDPIEMKWILCGSAIHNFLEDRLSLNTREIRDYYLNFEGRYARKDKLVVPEDMYERFDTCVENAESLGILDMKGQTEVKVKFGLLTPKERLVTIDARADFIPYGGDDVKDWKSGKDVCAAYHQEEYNIQGNVYTLAFNKKETEFISLLDKSRYVVKGNSKYIPALIDEYLDAIESGNLPMRKNYGLFGCGACEYRTACFEREREGSTI